MFVLFAALSVAVRALCPYLFSIALNVVVAALIVHVCFVYCT